MTETNRKASATARTRATTKYHKAHYKRMYISTTPDQADYIRETAKKYDITIVQLIIDSIKLFDENAKRLPAGAATPSGTADPMPPEQPEQPEPEKPEADTTESPIELGETAGTQPEEETETENEIETEEETEEEAEDIPEELKAVRAAWARMGAFNEKITAERKRREAEERERRREITDEERYMMR